ncbi:MAG: hypothetical protein QW611_04315 [Ignisphaera sp.]
MMRRKALVIIVLIVSMIPALESVTDVRASNVVTGVVTHDSMLLVVDNTGAVVGAYPSELEIISEYTKFYEDIYINNTVEYKILKCRAWWGTNIPAGMFYVPEIDGIIKIEPRDISIMCYTKVFNRSGYIYDPDTNTTAIYINSSAGVAVKISIRISVDIVRIGVRDLSILRLGNYILHYVLYGNNPYIFYEVEVDRIIDGIAYRYSYFDYFIFDLSQAELSIFIVEVWLNKIEIGGYLAQGNLSIGGVSLKPIYNAEVCGKISGRYGMPFSMIVSLSDKENILTIPVGRTVCTTLSNITLTPGANQTISMNVRSGAFSLTLRYEEINIEGLVISISRPFGRVIASGTSWTAILQSMVSVSGYYREFPSVRVEGSVTNDFFGSFSCQSLTINREGTYTLVCENTIYKSFNPIDIENSNFRVMITYFDERGKVWQYTTDVRVPVMDPSTIAGQVSMIYTTASNIVLMGIIAALVLYIISYIKELFTGFPLLDLYMLRGAMLTMIVAYAVLSVGIPMVYYIFGKIIENMPLLNRYVSPITSTDPRVAFGEMISYYDQLFTAIMRDYEVEFVGSIGKIMAWIQVTTAVAMSFMVIALALSTIWTPGAGIPFSSIASGIMSLVFGIISMMMMQVQMGVFAIVAVTVSRVMVFVVTAVILTLMVLGVMLICIPTSLTQRIGEDLFGAGIIYMIAFPLLAPLSYSIYMHIMDTVKLQGPIEAIANICVYVPAPICFSGFVPFFIKMITFVVASGIATLLILGSLGYILSRTGVATGLGEALSSLVWRG